MTVAQYHAILVMLGLILSVGIIIAVVLTEIAIWVRDIRSFVIGIHDKYALGQLDQKEALRRINEGINAGFGLKERE